MRALASRVGRRGVPAAVIAAAIGATIVVGVVSEAASTITTPNSVVVSYTLAPGATSAGITPTANSPVLLMGVDSTTADFGIGSINLVHIAGTEIRWVGQESSTGAITHGATAAPGTHVVYLDASHKVDVEILSADALVVHNGATTTQTGKLTLIW